MKIKDKLIELSNRYPKDVILYNQDVKNLMKLPARIPGEFDKQLLEFLKITNGALTLDSGDRKVERCGSISGEAL